jgi:hypothetical protein
LVAVGRKEAIDCKRVVAVGDEISGDSVRLRRRVAEATQVIVAAAIVKMRIDDK